MKKKYKDTKGLKKVICNNDHMTFFTVFLILHCNLNGPLSYC